MSRILVVDDSRVARAVLTTLLNAAGYPDVGPADSVGSAFALLGVNTAAPAANEIDLILMDITMPEVDGIAAIRQIRATAALRDIPIIVVTGRVAPENLKMAFDAGAMDYLTKPLHEIELVARVKSALKLKYEMDQRKARERELVQVLKQLETANQLLQHSSSTDDSTGVANRRQFDGVLAMEWARATMARRRVWSPLRIRRCIRPSTRDAIASDARSEPCYRTQRDRRAPQNSPRTRPPSTSSGPWLTTPRLPGQQSTVSSQEP